MTPSFDALLPFGWDEGICTLYRSLPPDRPGLMPGRVVRVDLDRCLVATEAGTLPSWAAELPAVGDWVVLAPRPDADPGWAVASVLERRSALTRRAVGEGSAGQVLAANVDVVAVVTGLDRPLNLRRLERELVLAWDSGARPLVVLNKADLHPDPAAAERAVRARVPHVDVVRTSTVAASGVAAMAEAVQPNRTMVLLGASGVGKSSLVNLLAGAQVQPTAEVRVGDHKGRHTTTARHVVVLPGGGVLIDTPGVRGLALWDAADAVDLAYADIAELATGCRFVDCAHGGEPGCAVAEAVAGGGLAPERLAHYDTLRREAARVEQAGDPRARARKRRLDRSTQLAYRGHVRQKRWP